MFSLLQNNDLNLKKRFSVNGTDSECCSFSFHTLRIKLFSCICSKLTVCLIYSIKSRPRINAAPNWKNAAFIRGL